MTEDYLADADEAPDAADFYMKTFAEQGAQVGQPVSLVVTVSDIPPNKVSKVERRLRDLYDCLRLEKGETGLVFFKKPSIRAHLAPMEFERANLLAAAQAQYRLILDEDVRVGIEMA
jgi:hypothetical protein